MIFYAGKMTANTEWLEATEKLMAAARLVIKLIDELLDAAAEAGGGES